MAGVNRSNVAVTDTFDTWRLRTNEINTTINEATDAITANTIIFRDDDSNFIANTASLNAVSITHGTTTTALNVISGLAAASDGSVASILTSGGIYGTLSSKFAADLTIGTDLTVQGSTVLGNQTTDLVTFTGRIASATNIIPAANNSSDLGSADLQFQKIHSEQNLIVATQDINANVFSVTSANGAGHTAVIKNDAAVSASLLHVSSDSTNTGTRSLVHIINDNTAATGATALHIKSDAGKGLLIDSNLIDSGPSLEITSSQTTTNSISITSATTTATGMHHDFTGITTGIGTHFESSGTAMADDSSIVKITQGIIASSANAAAMRILGQGSGSYGIRIDSEHQTANASMHITSNTTTQNVVEVVAKNLSSGNAVDVSSDQEHSGKLLSISSSATADSARGEGLFIDFRTANTSANALRINNGSNDTFKVSAAGDVTLLGNLHVVGTTTQVNSTTTLVKDKSIVLGAQSNVVTGATYTAANPAVVTTTANHGLNDNDIIFVVSSTGTGIVSEQLVKVTSSAATSFTAQTIGGTNIDASTDSTSRTFSYVGAQTDALVDEAGIQVPGSTAVHSILWDDDDNYWKLNDSVKVDTTGQLLFPVGTTAQRPTGSASTTSPAATVGAMRFNSDEGKFEGVTSGTSFESMATEGFGIALAVALG